MTVVGGRSIRAPSHGGGVRARNSSIVAALTSCPSTCCQVKSSVLGLRVFGGLCSYMSSEQAPGKTVDKGIDIRAFGCVLFETPTGKRGFDAGHVFAHAYAHRVSGPSRLGHADYVRRSGRRDDALPGQAPVYHLTTPACVYPPDPPTPTPTPSACRLSCCAERPSHGDCDSRVR
jgi:hypothetical protein